MLSTRPNLLELARADSDLGFPLPIFSSTETGPLNLDTQEYHNIDYSSILELNTNPLLHAIESILGNIIPLTLPLPCQSILTNFSENGRHSFGCMAGCLFVHAICTR